MEESIRIGAQTGIDTTQVMTPALAMRLTASHAILQLTNGYGGKMSYRDDKKLSFGSLKFPFIKELNIPSFIIPYVLAGTSPHFLLIMRVT